MECYVQHPRGSTRGIKYTIFMDIVSLKVICRKQDVLKLVECVCDCFFEQIWRCWVQKHSSFVCRLNGTELSFVQLSSSPRLRPLGRRPRESRLRQHAAALGGSQRPRRGCGAFALQRRRGGRQEQRWPGASKWWEAGPEIESPTWGTSEGFSGLKFMDFAYHGCSQYQRIAASPCQCCCIVGLKLPDCSRICSSDEREIADVARGNERQ